MNIRELVTKIGFDVDTKAFAKVDSAVKNIGVGLRRLGFFAIGAATSIEELIRRTGNAAEDIMMGAKAIGISTAALQEYQYAAGQAGVSTEELQTGLTRFARNVGEAAKTGTGEFVDQLNLLGVTLTDSKGNLKPTGVLLTQVSDALSRVKDSTAQTAAGFTLFGRGAAKLTQVLAQGSGELSRVAQEAKDRRLILSDEELAALDKASDSISRFWSLIKVLFAQLALKIGPTVERFISGLERWIDANRDLLNQRIDTFLQRLGQILSFIGNVVDIVRMSWEWLVNVLRGADNAVMALAVAFAAIKLWPLISGLGALIPALIRALGMILFFQGGIIAIPLLIAAAAYGLYKGIETLLESMGLVRGETEESKKAFDTLVATLTALGIILAAVVLGFSLYPILIFILVVAIIKLYKLLKDLPWAEYWEMLKAVWQNFVDNLKNILKRFKEWIAGFSWKGMLDGLKEEFFGFLKWLTGDWKDHVSKFLTGVGIVGKIGFDAAKDALGQTAIGGAMLGQGSLSPSTTNNSFSRPVNITSGITVNVPQGLSGAATPGDVGNAVALAVQQTFESLLSDGLYNSTRLE